MLSFWNAVALAPLLASMLLGVDAQQHYGGKPPSKSTSKTTSKSTSKRSSKTTSRSSSDACPASTPFTTVYVTSSATIVTVVSTSYVYETFPTTATLPRSCPTFYSPTDRTDPATSCAFETSTCTVLECFSISTVYPPCELDACCGPVPTKTKYADCPTACPTGCGGTSYQVIQPPCIPPTNLAR